MSGAREWLSKVKRKLTGTTAYEDTANSWNGNFELAKETIVRWATHDVAELQRHAAADSVFNALVDQRGLRLGFKANKGALIAFFDPLMVDDFPWKQLVNLLIDTGDVFIAQVLKNLKRDAAGSSRLLEGQSDLEKEIEAALQMEVENEGQVAIKEAKLLPLYTELAEVNRKLLEHAEFEADRKAKLAALVTAGKNRAMQIETDLATTKVHSHAAQASKHQREETLIPRVAELKEERAVVDRKLEELENVKQRLKLELEKISQEMAQVTETQKVLMAKEEAMNSELDALRVSTAAAVKVESEREDLLRVESRAKTETISAITELLKSNNADKKVIEIRAAAEAAHEVASAAVDRHAATLVSKVGEKKDLNIVEDVRKLVEKFSFRFLSDDRKKELQNLV